MSDNISQEDIKNLKELFKGHDAAVVEGVFYQLDKDFEKTFKALKNMQMSQEQHAMGRVTNEQKLAFFVAVFDQLEKVIIESILEQKKWDAGNALDTLFELEEQREKAEEEKRKKEAEARKRKEEEERKLYEAELKKVERHNKILALQAIFPKLHPQMIASILADKNGNEGEATTVLLQLEEDRALREEQQKNLQAERKQAEERRRRLAEAVTYESKAAEAVQNNLSKIEECKDWNQVNKIVNDSATDAAAAELLLKEKDKCAMILVAREIFPQLAAIAIRRVFEKNNWKHKETIDELKQIDFARARSQLQAMFPHLEPSMVDSVLAKYYPDSSPAIQELTPYSNNALKERLSKQMFDSSLAELGNALQRQKAFDNKRRDIEAKNKKMQSQDFGVGQEFSKAVAEMQQLKQKRLLDEEEQRLMQEIRAKQEKVDKAREALENVKMLKMEAHKRCQQPNKQKQERNLNSYFTKRYKEEQERLRIEHSEQQKVKQSIIAQNLQAKLGKERFAKLQKAIGDAPGGVVRGFHRPEYTNDPSAPPAKSIPLDQSQELINDLENFRESGSYSKVLNPDYVDSDDEYPQLEPKLPPVQLDNIGPLIDLTPQPVVPALPASALQLSVPAQLPPANGLDLSMIPGENQEYPGPLYDPFQPMPSHNPNVFQPSAPSEKPDTNAESAEERKRKLEQESEDLKLAMKMQEEENKHAQQAAKPPAKPPQSPQQTQQQSGEQAIAKQQQAYQASHQPQQPIASPNSPYVSPQMSGHLGHAVPPPQYPGQYTIPPVNHPMHHPGYPYNTPPVQYQQPYPPPQYQYYAPSHMSQGPYGPMKPVYPTYSVSTANAYPAISQASPYVANLHVRVISAKMLFSKRRDGLCDARVSVRLLGDKSQPKQRTRVIKRHSNPVWNREFRFGLRSWSETLVMKVENQSGFGRSTSLGSFSLNVAAVPRRQRIVYNVNLQDTPRGQLAVELLIEPRL